VIIVQVPQSRWSFENHRKAGDVASRIRPEALSASVNQLSGRIRNAFEVMYFNLAVYIFFSLFFFVALY
jgi:hypothetical protein